MPSRPAEPNTNSRNSRIVTSAYTAGGSQSGIRSSLRSYPAGRAAGAAGRVFPVRVRGTGLPRLVQQGPIDLLVAPGEPLEAPALHHAIPGAPAHLRQVGVPEQCGEPGRQVL